MSANDSIVIYHADCFDGFTSAWAFREWNPEAEAVFVPAKHGDAPPDVSGQHVYVLDFAYPRAELLRMEQQAASILVLDHHKTAQADLEGLSFCQFDMNRSGAGITWDYFADNMVSRHWLVNIVEDRDLWRFKYGDQTRFAMAYIAALPMDFETWDHLANDGIEPTIEKGSAIQLYIDSSGEKVCQQALFRELAGFTIPIINISTPNCSDHIDRLIKLHSTYPFGASFFLRADGKWQFSLRSAGDFDVSEIAHRFGGGGHKNAAGFVVSTLPWDNGS